MKASTLFFSVASLSLLALGVSAQSAEEVAQEAEYEAFLNEFPWQDSGAGELDQWATIEIPRGFRYLDGVNTDKLMQAFGNLPGEYEGMIAVPDVDWFVLFQFEETGYVKDDEKDDLNPDKLLKDIQAGDEPSNAYRRENGLEPLYTVGWAIPPKYNEATNNLEWGILLRGESGGESVNYNTKLLGRNGIMNVTLVCDPEDLTSILGTYQTVLAGHEYKAGKSYAEFQEGDKIANYGLTALIAGGALYGAAKLGLLAQLGVFFKKGFKFIIAAVVGLGVLIKRFFTNLGGGQGMDRSNQD